MRFVLSSRPPDEALRAFAEKQKPYLEVLTIAPTDNGVQGGIHAYLAQPEVASELEKTKEGADGFATCAVAKVEGNLDHLNALERGIDGALERDDRPAVQILLALRDLPAGLRGLYAFSLRQVRTQVQRKRLAAQVRVAMRSQRPHLLQVDGH